MSEEKIIKPMSIVRQEFISNLTDLINTCMLPPFIIEEILKDAYSKVCAISRKQLEEDIRKYNSALSLVDNANKN